MLLVKVKTEKQNLIFLFLKKKNSLKYFPTFHETVVRFSSPLITTHYERKGWRISKY